MPIFLEEFFFSFDFFFIIDTLQDFWVVNENILLVVCRIEEEPNTQMERKPVVPLCWDDQVNNPRARVISPRSQNNDQPRPVS